MKGRMDYDTLMRVRRESEAHDGDSVLENSYKLKNRFSHIWSYPSRKEIRQYVDAVIGKMSGKRVLDYGCGWGAESVRYLATGARVYGIDISRRFVESARALVGTQCPDHCRYDFDVMDAHQLLFNEEEFDYVIGNGILHHLNQEIALREVYRVLRPGGEAIFFEPLADNPLLKLFRWLTPDARTADERPLTGKDLAEYSRMLPWKANYHYCGIIEAPVAMLTSILMKNHPENPILWTAHIFEQWLNSHGVTPSWNQYVLLVFRKQ